MSKRYWIVLTLFSILIVSRLIYINSGILISEPDEWYFFMAADSLHHGWIPMVVGKPEMEHSPLFQYLAYLVSFVVQESIHPRTYIATRLVSVLASVGLAIAMVWYVKQKINQQAALYSLILLTIIPISLFYSKVGLHEMLLILFIFLFYIAIERLNTSKGTVRQALIAGGLLGLAIDAKTTATVMLSIPVLNSGVTGVKLLLANRFNAAQRVGVKNEWQTILRSAVLNATTLAVAGGVWGLGLLPGFLTYPAELKDDLIRTTIRHSSSSLQSVLISWEYYGSHLTFWFGAPILALVLVGFGLSLRKGRSWLQAYLFMGVLVTVLSLNEARGRYFVLLLPFFTLLAALALDAIVERVNSQVNKIAGYSIAVLTFLVTLPGTYTALQSTNHSLIEQAVVQLRADYPNADRTIFSSFWPPIIQTTTGFPSARLTLYKDDVNRDFKEYPAFSPQFSDHPVLFLLTPENRGKFVYLVMKPQDTADLKERFEAVKLIENGLKPAYTFQDNKPNFPDTSDPYTITIYKNEVSQ